MYLSEDEPRVVDNQQPNVVIKTWHRFWTFWNSLGKKSKLFLTCYVVVYTVSIFVTIALYSKTQKGLAGSGCGLQILAYLSLYGSWVIRSKFCQCCEGGSCIDLVMDWMQQYFVGLLPFILHFVGSALVSVVGFSEVEYHKLGLVASILSWASFIITCSMSCMTLCRPPPETDRYSFPNWV